MLVIANLEMVLVVRTAVDQEVMEETEVVKEEVFTVMEEVVAVKDPVCTAVVEMPVVKEEVFMAMEMAVDSTIMVTQVASVVSEDLVEVV